MTLENLLSSIFELGYRHRVVASAESQAIIGFDKATGQERWRQEAEGLDGMWGTPALVKVGVDRTDLVMCVAKELWGLDPDSGKVRWFANATGAEHAYSSVITDADRVFAFTGRGGGSVAVKAGGSGDVSDSSILWTGNENASFSLPVRYKSNLYVDSQGMITIVDSQSGATLDQIRLQGAERTGGRFGSLDYASPIVVGDRLMYLNGSAHARRVSSWGGGRPGGGGLGNDGRSEDTRPDRPQRPATAG